MIKLREPRNLIALALILIGVGYYAWHLRPQWFNRSAADSAPLVTPPRRTPPPPEADEAARLLHDATLAGDYLVRAVREGGRFVYEYDPESDEKVDGYNMLRHAGSIYAMAELYDLTRDPSLRAAIELAIGYMKEQIAEREHDAVMLDTGDVKLGGNGLATLALTRWAQATGDDAHIPLARKLARWITSTQNDDGSFAIHKQNWKTKRVDEFISSYYPGEAAYGLATLGQHVNDRSLIDAARRAALHSATRQTRDGLISAAEHDHWLLYAIAKLYAIDPDPVYTNAARPFVVAILDAQHVAGIPGVPPEWVGGWYHPPRTTPTSCRCEGLAAVLRMYHAAGDSAFADRIELGLAQGVGFILRNFIDDARAAKMPDPAQSLGGVTASLDDASIRIDYVQHALSAILGYRHALKN